jgi:hypothetical protein
MDPRLGTGLAQANAEKTASASDDHQATRKADAATQTKPAPSKTGAA